MWFGVDNRSDVLKAQGKELTVNYCGLDMGKKSSQYCIVNERREIVREGKVRNTVEALGELFRKWPRMRVVIEASTKSFWMADVVELMGHEPVVVDPGRTKAIGSSLIKNDKLDARVLAILNAADILAVVSRATKRERLARMPVVVRDALVQGRSKLMLTVRSLLDSEGIEVKSAAANAFTGVVRKVVEDALSKELASVRQPILAAID
jgi:hypothetical protein